MNKNEREREQYRRTIEIYTRQRNEDLTEITKLATMVDVRTARIIELEEDRKASALEIKELRQRLANAEERAVAAGRAEHALIRLMEHLDEYISDLKSKK